jgi:hypothetical protein
MEICHDVDDWIETNVVQQVRKQEKRCKKWPWPLSWLCSLVTFLVDVIVTVWQKVIRVVCEVIVFVWSVIATIINAILALPIIGFIIRAIIRLVTWVISVVVGLIDGFGGLFGIRLTKHLRVHVVPLCDGDIPLAFEQHLQPIMDETTRILHERAKIQLHVTYHEPVLDPPSYALRLGVKGDLILDELWLKGTWQQWNTLRMFDSSISSLFAIGAPIVVYVIREVGYDGPGTTVGASGGPFVDWVVVERDYVVHDVIADGRGGVAQPPAPYPPVTATPSAVAGILNPDYSPRVVAHEICHALGLLGHANSNPNELMYYSNIEGDHLSPFQVGLIRSSPHVTYV